MFTAVMTGLGGSLTKNGGGVFILQGNNTYSGPTTVTGGTLLVNGQQPNSAVSLFNSAVLGGSGRVGNISASFGHVAPGNSPGQIECANLAFTLSSQLRIEINGASPGSGYDQVATHGTVNFNGGALNLVMGTIGVVSNQYVIVSNDGADAVTGNFIGLPEGASITNNGATFVITYHGGDGNDVVLTQKSTPPGPQLSSVQKLGNGTVQINGTGLPNATYNVEATENLTPPIPWTNIGAATANALGQFIFTDRAAPQHPIRFYRFGLP